MNDYAQIPQGLSGADLHASVPFERWCVQQKHLRQLRRDVHKAVRDGLVKPTVLDPFDPEDAFCGPCVHTVVEQFIRPVSRLAGGSSWALMMQPDGGKCDIFVSHCWQEGLYEFIDKVLGSWPRGAKYAYCCMLSNPQTLDIASLVASPKESPFAAALAVADYVLVVSNHHCSIFSRIWCVYEAYLAERLGKKIMTAAKPIRNFWWQLLYAAIANVSGSAIAIFAMLFWEGLTRGYPFFIVFCVSLSVTSVSIFYVIYGHGENSTNGLLLYFTACMCGFNSILWFVPAKLTDNTDQTLLALDGDFPLNVSCFMEFSLILCSLCMAADRQWHIAAQLQAQELRKEFTGSVIDAQCSVQGDKQKILLDISSDGSLELVDTSINVLLHCGMSTPSLREAARHGVELQDAGQYKSATVLSFFMLFGWLTILDPHIERQAFFDLLFSLEALLACVCCIIISEDQRGFAWKTWYSVFELPLFISLAVDVLMSIWMGHPYGWALCVAAENPSRRAALYLAVEHSIIGFVLFPILVALTIAGPGRTARVPWLGPYIVRAISGGIRDKQYVPLSSTECSAGSQRQLMRFSL